MPEMQTPPPSVLTKDQKLVRRIKFEDAGTQYRIKAEIRFDDQCGNGHNTFAITGTLDESKHRRWRDICGGCIHDEIATHLPELEPFLKWHLTSTDGPVHYVANTVYHASNRDLDAARRSAVWPEATDEQLCLPKEELTKILEARLPALMTEFKKDIESLGLVY